MSTVETFIKKLDDENLWKLYPTTIKELIKRGLATTRNLVGEYGEFIAINHYNKTRGLPKLQKAPASTKNVDALSRDGDRYSIKTITAPNKTTGVFYGLHPLGSSEINEKKFEYAIIVSIDKDFNLLKILQINWDVFIDNKKWHSRMTAWNLSISKKLVNSSKIIYENTKR